jgi:uncharacterized protein (TIGR00730 family)
MIRASDAFIAVPGGTGTLDELFEVLAMKQTGRLKAPVVLFNVNGYWDALTVMLVEVKAKGFISYEIEDLFYCTNRADEIVKMFGHN